MYIGVHLLPVKNCVAPGQPRLLRKVDKVFLASLKQKMVADPTAPGQYLHTAIGGFKYSKDETTHGYSWMHAYSNGIGTPPIAAFCKDAHIKGPEDFKLVHQKVYKYEVLGGLHGVIARQELLEECPGN